MEYRNLSHTQTCGRCAIKEQLILWRFQKKWWANCYFIGCTIAHPSTHTYHLPIGTCGPLQMHTCVPPAYLLDQISI